VQPAFGVAHWGGLDNASHARYTVTAMTDTPSQAARIGRPLRMLAVLVALFTVVLGVGGLLSPDSVTAVRRQNLATPIRLYTAAAVRVAMGLVVILAATASRAPHTLRLFGALMCMQGLSATLLGPEHARTVLEWETMRPAFLRAGAAVALASGLFMLFAVTTGRRPATLP
jgi:hypothetical protein